MHTFFSPSPCDLPRGTSASIRHIASIAAVDCDLAIPFMLISKKCFSPLLVMGCKLMAERYSKTYM
jgi:hypothetical protein